MLPGPVFFHELRAAARRRRSFVVRAAIGLMLLYIVATPARWWYYGPRSGPDREYSPGELAMIGQSLFSSVVWVQAIVILTLTPALVAGAIAEERQRKVLSYLLASPLSGAEIVLGKLVARLINLVVLISLGLPVISLALFLGGIEPTEVWLAYGLSMTTVYLLAALSIFVSTFSTRTRDAILWAYLIEFVWLILPLCEELIAGSGGAWAAAAIEARPITDWITLSSPSRLIVSWNRFTGQANSSADVFWMMGLQLAYGTLLLVWPTLRLRAVERGARLWSWQRLGMRAQSRPLRIFSRRACGDDPILWKECTSTLGRGSVKRTAVVLVITLSAVAGLVFWVYELGVPAFQETFHSGYGATGFFSAIEDFNVSARALTCCLYIVTGLVLGAVAATSVTGEHEADTWVSLMATPLESIEILRGKLLGAFWRVRGLLLALAVVWLAGLACGGVHPLGLLLTAVLTLIDLLFIAALGTFISLGSKTSARAIGLTIGLLVVFNGGYLFCCIPFMDGPESMIVVAGISPLIVTTALFSFQDLDGFMSSARAVEQGRLVMTGIISLGWYGIASICLIRMCLERIEAACNRPSRPILMSPCRVSSAGITFLDDDAERPEDELPGDTDGTSDAGNTS
jgi:ABC-type transport system involved in multi-copper enzyme maturation permease subunit